MTNQEIFEKVAIHLFFQGVRSIKENHSSYNSCLYRGPRGLKCAVGIFIPDELYEARMDNGMNVKYLIQLYPKFAKNFSRNVNLMTALQAVHDRASSWDTTAQMRERLREVASQFKLKRSFLNNLCFSNR